MSTEKSGGSGRTVPRPLPPTGTIPEAGRIFFDADRGKSYRLARQGLIVTKDIGTRGKIALLHPTAKLLGIEP
jgi:hypothetical protein